MTERRPPIFWGGGGGGGGGGVTPRPHRTKITCFNTTEQQTGRENGTIF